MKFYLGGNIDSEIYEIFRINRNIVYEKLSISLENNVIITNMKEFSVHIFIRQDASVENIAAEYNKRQKRAETECVIDYETFKESDDQRKQQLIQQEIKFSVKALLDKGIITTTEFTQLSKWIDDEIN